MAQAMVEGQAVKVGDTVCFKSDVEQCGQVVSIQPAQWGTGHMLTLSSKYGFSGEYIGGQTRTTVDTRDCWIE